MRHWLWLLFGTLRVLLHDRRTLLVENLLLRQQLAVALRANPRPRLQRRDRLSPQVTDSSGIACFGGLTFGTYTVHENVPSGYSLDAPGNDRSVTVDTNAGCADSPYGGETISFHNTPLTDVTISINSQVDGGTASTVTCTNTPLPSLSITTGANGDGAGTATGLGPQTFTCTILIDP